MISAPPLQNKRVMIPRGAKQAKAFSDLVERLGGIPAEIPLIAFRPIPVSEALSNRLKDVHKYDWIVFTSNVTVETFFSFYEKDGQSFPKIAVIGSKTREALEQQHYQASFTPNAYVAERFVEEFLPHLRAGMRVLIPKGNLAREYISTTLKKHGVIVDELIIYETYMPGTSRSKLAQTLREGKLDILAFTSPSTIDHFMETVRDYHLEARIQDCIIACIGPVSKRKAEAYGLTVHACPVTYTVEDMMNSVIEYLRNEEEE